MSGPNLVFTVQGTVSVTSVGDISADGDGIDAESDAGAVVVDSTGDITADDNGVEVFDCGAATSDVILKSGAVYGQTAGVNFNKHSTNSLKNYAELSGGTLAVQGAAGDDTIENFNLITGDVDLGGGTNAFFNRAGGTLRSGGTVDLGGGTLTNEGDLSPGGTGTVQTTAITGDLVQTADGSFTVDLDESGAGVDKLDHQRYGGFRRRGRGERHRPAKPNRRIRHRGCSRSRSPTARISVQDTSISA